MVFPVVFVIQSPSNVSLWPHGIQHARLPCPSLTPRACSNSCPSSQWCHSTISSSVMPFSSYLQSFPASGSFLMSQFLASCAQTIGVSASASVLPMNIQDWFSVRWTGWISLKFKGLSRVFANNSSASILQHSAFFMVQTFPLLPQEYILVCQSRTIFHLDRHGSIASSLLLASSLSILQILCLAILIPTDYSRKF